MNRRALLAMAGAASIHLAAALAQPTDRARRIGSLIFGAEDAAGSPLDELRAKLPREALRWLDGMSAAEIAEMVEIARHQGVDSFAKYWRYHHDPAGGRGCAHFTGIMRCS